MEPHSHCLYTLARLLWLSLVLQSDKSSYHWSQVLLRSRPAFHHICNMQGDAICTLTTSCLCWQIQLIKLSCICLFFAWACTSPAKIFVSHSFAKCNAVVTKYLQITLTAELQKEAAHYCTFCGFSNGSKITNTNKKNACFCKTRQRRLIAFTEW